MQIVDVEELVEVASERLKWKFEVAEVEVVVDLNYLN